MTSSRKNMRILNRKGFSLVEMLVVIALLGTLAAIGVQQFAGVLQSVRDLVDEINGDVLFDGVFEAGGISTNGEITNMAWAIEGFMRSDFISLKPATRYVLKEYEAVGDRPMVYYYGKDGFISYVNVQGSNGVFTTPSETQQIRLRFNIDGPGDGGPYITDVRIEES